MFAALARTIFGSHNDRVIKGYGKAVAAINGFEPEMQKMTDAQLAAQTPRLRKMIEQENKTLDDILPEAFATAREAFWQRVVALLRTGSGTR